MLVRVSEVLFFLTIFLRSMNPYESPRTTGRKECRPRRDGWGCLKHLVIFGGLLVWINIGRFVGMRGGSSDVKAVSFTAGFLGLLFFYGVGYFVFSHVRSRK